MEKTTKWRPWLDSDEGGNQTDDSGRSGDEAEEGEHDYGYATP